MATVMIVEDHPVISAGIRSILNRAGFQVDVQAADGDRALAALRTNCCDMVLLDLSLPGKSGFDVLQDLKSQKPRLPVLVFSCWPEQEYGVRAIRAGAAGYVSKSVDADTLIAAARKVVGGARYVSAELAEKLLFQSCIADKP